MRLAGRSLGQRIDQQVAMAIRAVHDAAAGLARVAQAEKDVQADRKKYEVDAEAAGDKGARIRLWGEEALVGVRRVRLEALYKYNQAVARLEQAIGLPIEEAFATARAAK